ncbi:MAG: (d)CMP kinase [Bythopirellula sp.]|nr:(d)CMP kinase [Bythopirellula sp.]
MSLPNRIEDPIRTADTATILAETMIVTIDGPAGSGKSSAARKLAKRLGFRFLDTGAMYRAIALAGSRNGVDWNDPEPLAHIAASVTLELVDDRVILDGEDVSSEIRTVEITRLTRHAADNQKVRQILVDLQRRIAGDNDVVAEGRDQATVAFPQAECKIFLTATEHVRAERRYLDLVDRGERITLDSVQAAQRLRDQQDQDRDIGGLRKAPDSVEICTDGLTPVEVVDKLEELVRSRMTKT